jgi:hypothetical protein
VRQLIGGTAPVVLTIALMVTARGAFARASLVF